MRPGWSKVGGRRTSYWQSWTGAFAFASRAGGYIAGGAPVGGSHATHVRETSGAYRVFTDLGSAMVAAEEA